VEDQRPTRLQTVVRSHQPAPLFDAMFSSSSFANDSAPQPQLHGKRARLQRELALAFSGQPLSHALIERIVGDLALVENALAGAHWHRSHERAVERAGGPRH
jgi:hypothetical protein